MNPAARAASLHARLLNGARERREDFNLTLGRYAVERFLYRISISEARDQFVLKGALLFDLWFDTPHRPTRDADFLGLGSMDAVALTQTMRTVCMVEADDGMRYDPATVETAEIRAGQHEPHRADDHRFLRQDLGQLPASGHSEEIGRASCRERVYSSV